MTGPLLGEHDLVALLDDEGRFVYASPSHQSILGYAPDELQGIVRMNLVHPDDVASAREQVEQQRGEAGARVVRVRAKSGAWLRLEETIYAIGGDSALAGHSIVSLRKVDAREEARLARETAQERERALSAQLEAVLRHAPLGIGLVDRELRFVFVNEELAAMNGVSVEEHAGRTLSEVLPALEPTLRPLHEQVLATGEPIHGIAIEGETAARAGELRSWDASYHAVPGPDGVPEGVIAVVQETTRMRREELERRRLQRLVELSSDYVILSAPMANIVYLNAAGRQLAGLDPDEDVTKRSMQDLVAPEHRPRLEAEVVPALENDRVWRGIFPIRNVKTGEIVELDWAAFFVEETEYGSLIGAVGRDHRERRTAEARALESTQALETLFTLSPVPILSVDLERRVVRANAAMSETFGWSEAEMIGRPVPFEREPSEDVLAIRQAMREARAVSQAFTLRRRDGSPIRIVAYSSPQFDATGVHVGSIGFLFDVEEQERARERAERVGRQQETVAELGLFALTGAPVTAVLERAAELLAARLDVDFATVAELLPEGDEIQIVAGVGWREGLVGETRASTGSGSQAGYTLAVGVPVIVEDLTEETRFTCAPVLTEHGIVSGLSTVIRDAEGIWGVLAAYSSVRCGFDEHDVNFLRAMANVIAAAVRREETTNDLRALTRELEQRVEARTREVEAARQAAQEASTAKTVFLSRISHELRTPLNAIVGFGQLLAMDERDRDTRESVDQILAAGLHLVGLIDELLDVSQIEEGALELELKPIDVAELVDEVVGLVSPLAAEKGIRVGRAVSDDVVALADRRRLRQVLLNLLSNAIKYNRDAGAVEVALAGDKDQVSIAVRDTGLGIAAPDVGRIFEPFQRVPGAARIEGTGLGLTVSRGLVEAMGGVIRVESTPGAGSVFTVELPAAT